jgi:hypothetical protein
MKTDNPVHVVIHSALAGRYPAHTMRYYEILKHNQIPVTLVDASDLDYWQVVKTATHYVHHFTHREAQKQVAWSVFPIIDKVFKIPRFPNWESSWHYDDKIMESHLLEAMGYPFAKSWVFYDKEAALHWLKTASFPLVFKLKAGAGSGNVLLLKKPAQAERLVEQMFSPNGVDSQHIPDASSLSYFRNFFGLYRLRQHLANIRNNIHYQDINAYWQRHRDYVLFQEFLPDNRFDTRVTVIGDRAFAFRRHNRPDDFRASGSGNIDYDQSAIDKRCIDLALQISRDCGFQSMAYDFMFDTAGNPKIGEISYAYLDTAVAKCPGYYAGAATNWVEGNKWPQYWILTDLLGNNQLIQPELASIARYVRSAQ